jgi:ADP-ribose pyrophosphatase YjhB (NUDIX family)
MLKAASLVFGTRPVLCVDAIVRRDGKYLLVRRKNPPEGWALAGGHMDPWEKAADAAARELLEETGLRAENVRLFKVYSDPDRDPRYHAVSLVHVVDARGEAEASDDAAEAAWFTREECVQLDYAGLLAFDHGQILDDFWEDQ